ncbi:MAG: alkene reductase [Rhodospirillaceae bacterium]|nr:alkene reductase [Rhodospirillaceae bacterium]
MNDSPLLSPVDLGSVTLANRIVMAPMTRLRAPDNMPSQAMANYYKQRASAGLIITECTMVSATSAAYIGAPGMFHDRFIDPWRRITESVHESGGRIYLQLWHSGRVAHTTLMPDNMAPLAPSAVPANTELHTALGKKPASAPRALALDEIRDLTRAFGRAAERARKAQFDGVEIHGAFGYLIDQFLQDGSNKRTDAYGGNYENRTRFLLGVLSAVQQEFGRNVGLKLSPSSRAHSMSDSDPVGLFSFLLDALNDTDLAYLHMMEALPTDHASGVTIKNITRFSREHYRGTIIANGGFDQARGEDIVRSGSANLVSFGQPFIANPDLVERFQNNFPLSEPNFAYLYAIPGQPLELGYTDYPLMDTTR